MTLTRILYTIGIGAALGASMALPIAAMLAPVPTLPVQRSGVVL
jgi:hypothetical protein